MTEEKPKLLIIQKKKKVVQNRFMEKNLKRYKYCSSRKKCKTFKIDRKCLKYR